VSESDLNTDVLTDFLVNELSHLEKGMDMIEFLLKHRERI
jgi:hypothetical protein